jgi:LacI family transcriptional regulator
VQGENREETGWRAMRFWSELPEERRPTAVVAISDLEAIGVMRVAEQRGFVIGDTLSVIGFDDVPFSKYLRPALTTIRQPIPEAARLLVDMLKTVLDGEEPAPLNYLLPPKLIVRDSCGPPR